MASDGLATSQNTMPAPQPQKKAGIAVSHKTPSASETRPEPIRTIVEMKIHGRLATKEPTSAEVMSLDLLDFLKMKYAGTPSMMAGG